MSKWGFSVEQKKSGWRVFLPHQCDEWDIAGDRYEYVSHAEAVAELRSFVAEANDALTALYAERQF